MARHIARSDTEETATDQLIREAIQRHLGEDDAVISGLRLHGIQTIPWERRMWYEKRTT